MALKICNGFKAAWLKLAVNKITTPENVVLHIFTNNHTPADGDTVGTYTEDTDSGYAAITLTGASWSTSGTTPAHIAYAQQTFTYNASATGNRYGYYLTRLGTADLIGAELFSDGPYNVQNSGDTIKVTPDIDMDDA